MTQALATRGRASPHPAVSMATAGFINTAVPYAPPLPAGPTFRTKNLNLVPSLSVRKP